MFLCKLLSVLMVAQNMIELLIGLKALPVETKVSNTHVLLFSVFHFERQLI